MGRYDMGALMRCDLFDAAGASQTFPTREDFWVALTDLTSNAESYLQTYTPSVVCFSQEVQDTFLKELRDIRALLSSLRVHGTPVLLDGMSDAVARKDETSLADMLRVFHAEIGILRNAITEAMVPEREVAVKEKNERPVIMVVDDITAVLASVSEMLYEHYLVIAVTNAHSALQALETQTPALFLLDIQMPDVNGYELAKRIRSIERFKRTPIIFHSGNNTRKHVLAAMFHGGNGFLVKPASKDELLAKIGELLS